MAKLLSGTRIYGNATVDTFIAVGTNVAAANIVITDTSRLGNVTSGVWNGSSISTSFTDAKITSVAGQTGAISNTQLASAITTSGVLTTANVSEVTNLYFTNARVSVAISTQTLGNASFSGNITANQFTGNLSGDVTIAGNFNPSIDVTYNLGTPSKRWADLYLSGNTINLGDASISAIGSAINLPQSSSVGDQTISTFSGSYTDLTNKPANVISFSNTLIGYNETYNILLIDKNIYRSGEVRYNIIDDNTATYTSVSHNFIHINNTLSYSNTLISIGSQIHSSHIAIVGDNIVLFLVSQNTYATNYFLPSSDNYTQNATANLKGYVTLVGV